jgi:hypothetical protein
MLQAHSVGIWLIILINIRQVLLEFSVISISNNPVVIKKRWYMKSDNLDNLFENVLILRSSTAPSSLPFNVVSEVVSIVKLHMSNFMVKEQSMHTLKKIVLGFCMIFVKYNIIKFQKCVDGSVVRIYTKCRIWIVPKTLLHIWFMLITTKRGTLINSYDQVGSWVRQLLASCY